MMSLVEALSCALMIAGGAFAQVPQMVEGWPYRTRTEGNPIYATPRIAVKDDLSMSSVFFANATHDIDRFQFNGSQFPGWPVIADTIAFIDDGPIVVDIDHDGLDEIVTYGFVIPYLRQRLQLLLMLDDNGIIMSGFPQILSDPHSLNVADFDNDGEYEIMTATVGDSLLRCLDRYGGLKPGWPQRLPVDFTGHGPFGSGGAVGDLDLDGNNEYVLMAMYHIYAYRFDGTMQSGFPIAIEDTSFAFSNNWTWPPTLADVDLDGYLEILTTADDWIIDLPPPITSYVAMYEHTGQMKENWPVFFPDQLLHNAPTPADINNDGTMEIGVQASQLHFLDVNGNEIPGWPVTLWQPNGRPRASNADLVIVDIDGDRDCEIFTDFNSLYADSMGQDSVWYYGHGYLFGIDHLGQDLPEYPVMINGDLFCRPPTFGYDNTSRRLYMALFATKCLLPWRDLDTGYVDLYLFPDSTGPPDQWPMLSHDNLQTRNYNFVDNVVSVKDREEPVPENYVLRQNYPNPFNGSTVIEFSLPREEFVNLSVYDVQGRRVSKLADSRMTAGQHRVTAEMADMSSGVYFYVLTTEKNRISRKMILLR